MPPRTVATVMPAPMIAGIAFRPLCSTAGTRHYPYSEEILDYADAHGVVVVAETAAVASSSSATGTGPAWWCELAAFSDLIMINRYYGKPVLVTESGADAVAGLHTVTGAMWSEEFRTSLDTPQD